MQNDTSHLADEGKCAHESVGPTDPKDGPILPIEDADADKDVTISNP